MIAAGIQRDHVAPALLALQHADFGQHDVGHVVGGGVGFPEAGQRVPVEPPGALDADHLEDRRGQIAQAHGVLDDAAGAEPAADEPSGDDE